MTAVAQERLAARRRRFSRIRRWIAGAAVAVFIAAFSTLYVQMATGHDPALASSSKTSTAVVAAPANTQSSHDDESSSDESSSSGDSSATQSTPAPVITRQS